MDIEPIKRLTTDLKEAALTLSHREVRFLVDSYYLWQGQRKRAESQIKALAKSGEPHSVVGWIDDNATILERNIKSALDAFTNTHPVSIWAKGICGIGPVISAGLLAHINITRVQSAGQVWRFAGLDPTTSWEKGQRRPWNASLKTLAYHLGESFVKVSNNPKDVYGHLYAERKLFEVSQNEQGLLADQAAAKLKKFDIDKSTDAYKAYIQGRLPRAHVHARARRWVAKLFLAHFFQVYYYHHHKMLPEKPYVLSHLKHVHEIAVPNWPF